MDVICAYWKQGVAAALARPRAAPRPRGRALATVSQRMRPLLAVEALWSACGSTSIDTAGGTRFFAGVQGRVLAVSRLPSSTGRRASTVASTRTGWISGPLPTMERISKYNIWMLCLIVRAVFLHLRVNVHWWSMEQIFRFVGHVHWFMLALPWFSKDRIALLQTFEMLNVFCGQHEVMHLRTWSSHTLLRGTLISVAMFTEYRRQCFHIRCWNANGFFVCWFFLKT